MIHTYMTHSTPQATMQALDTKTLAKQRVDAKVVLEALQRNRGGWSHHPVVRQWSGYEGALKAYINAAIKEHILRKPRSIMEPIKQPSHFTPPWWNGSPELMEHYRELLANPEMHQTLWPRGARFPGQYVTMGPSPVIL